MTEIVLVDKTVVYSDKKSIDVDFTIKGGKVKTIDGFLDKLKTQPIVIPVYAILYIKGN